MKHGGGARDYLSEHPGGDSGQTDRKRGSRLYLKPTILLPNRERVFPQNEAELDGKGFNIGTRTRHVVGCQ